MRIAKSVDEVKEFAEQMLGSTLVTLQTGPKGKQVNRIYIEQGSAIEKEFYLSMLVDRESSRVAIVASTEGGMDIEKVAHDTPEKIVTITVDPVANICPHHVRRLSKALGLTGDLAKQMSPLITNLYKAFVESDMSLLEVNPLIITKDGKLVCLDAKIGFDDNALFRHPDLAALRDETEEDEKEIEASKYDLNYIALDGEIGCMVNGAGLAMATMDIIKLYGHGARELPRRRRRRDHREGDRRVQDHHLGPEREGHPGQHLRRHHEVRRDRRGRGHGREGSWPARAAGGAPRRHQCREGQGDHREVESQRDFGRRLDDAAQKIVKAVKGK